jgi:hypothetical protein
MLQPMNVIDMKLSIVGSLLVLAMFPGCDSRPAVVEYSEQADGQKLVDPCEVELPELFQRGQFEREKEQKEIDDGIRRKLTLQVSNEDILHLRHLKTSLKFLQVWGRKLSEDELKVLSELSNLESLNLADCDIDDHDLLILRPCLQNVKTLWLNNNPVSDDSMPLFAELRSLEGLGLANSQVTDAGAKRLPELRNLKGIDLSQTTVTDSAAESLAKCLQLTSVNIGHNKPVTNKTVAALVPLTSLQTLQIDNTSVNEDCLDDLIRMRNLRFFHTGGLQFSAEASRRLRAEAPMFGKFEELLKPYDGPRYTYFKIDCIDGWSFSKLKDKQKAWEAVMGITGGVELPADSHNIHAAEGGFGPDQKNFLVFSTTLEGATVFAEKMSGKKLAEFRPRGDRDSVHTYGEESHIQRGFPWQADTVTDNLFSKIPRSNGGILIDMKNLIVYLKQ